MREPLRALDEAALSATHWRITVVTALGEFLNGYDLLIMGGALLLLVPEFNLKPLQLGALTAAVYAGSIGGSLAAGWLADALGRRVTLIVDFFFFVACSIFAGVARNAAELIWARFLIGVGIGADVPPSYALIAEIAPRAGRGRLLGSLQVFWGLGGVAAALVSIPLIVLSGPHAWRWMFLSGVIPAIIVLLLRRSIPETPRWLLEAGNAAGAARAAGHVLGVTGSEPSGGQLGDWTSPLRRDRGMDLLRPQFLRMLIVVGAIQFFNTNASALLLIWGPLFVHSLGLTTTRGSQFFSLVLSSAFVVGTVLNTLLADRVGRRPLLLGAAAFQAVGFTLLAIAQRSVPHAILIMFPMLSAANLAAAVSAYTWTPEFFPTHVRARASSLLFASNRFGAVTIGLLTPALMALGRAEAVLMVGAVVEMAVLVIGLVWWRVETTGRSLEEIPET